MKGFLYLVSSFAIFAIGIAVTINVHHYSLYEEYRFVKEIALYSTQKEYLMNGMVKEQGYKYLVNLCKSVFIFLLSFVIMKKLLNKAIDVSSNERNVE